MFLSAPVGAHRLDEANGADGDEVLNAHAGIFKAPGDIDHKAQVMFDQLLRADSSPMCAMSSASRSRFKGGGNVSLPPM